DRQARSASKGEEPTLAGAAGSWKLASYGYQETAAGGGRGGCAGRGWGGGTAGPTNPRSRFLKTWSLLVDRAEQRTFLLLHATLALHLLRTGGGLLLALLGDFAALLQLGLRPVPLLLLRHSRLEELGRAVQVGRSQLDLRPRLLHLRPRPLE